MRKTRRRLVIRGEFVGESVSPDITISAAHFLPQTLCLLFKLYLYQILL